MKSGIVANHHHAKQGSGNLSHPAETTEDKEGRCNEAEHTHTRDIAAEEVAEEVAEHVAAVAIGHAAKEIADTVQVIAGSTHGFTDAVHGITGSLAEVADGIADSFHLLANAVDGVRTDDGITDDSGDALVCGQLLPCDIAGGCSDGCRLGGCTHSLDGLLRMEDGVADGLCRCLCAATHEFQSGFQYCCPTHIAFVLIEVSLIRSSLFCCPFPT